jgi:hypothetical protein
LVWGFVRRKQAEVENVEVLVVVFCAEVAKAVGGDEEEAAQGNTGIETAAYAYL